jgi:hypothetical protein
MSMSDWLSFRRATPKCAGADRERLVDRQDDHAAVGLKRVEPRLEPNSPRLIPGAQHAEGELLEGDHAEDELVL